MLLLFRFSFLWYECFTVWKILRFSNLLYVYWLFMCNKTRVNSVNSVKRDPMYIKIGGVLKKICSISNGAIDRVVPLNRILRIPRDRCMGKWDCLNKMVGTTSSPSLQHGLLCQSRRLPNPFLADLNAPLANSTLQIDLELSAADPTDAIRIVRGRMFNSKEKWAILSYTSSW